MKPIDTTGWTDADWAALCEAQGTKSFRELVAEGVPHAGGLAQLAEAERTAQSRDGLEPSQ